MMNKPVHGARSWHSDLKRPRVALTKRCVRSQEQDLPSGRVPSSHAGEDAQPGHGSEDALLDAEQELNDKGKPEHVREKPEGMD